MRNRKSDNLVVPVKAGNAAGGKEVTCLKQCCEDTLPIRRGGMMVETKLQHIAEKARENKTMTFTSIYHLLNVELFRACFHELRGDAAVGIDKVTKAQYEVRLE